MSLLVGATTISIRESDGYVNIHDIVAKLRTYPITFQNNPSLYRRSIRYADLLTKLQICKVFSPWPQDNVGTKRTWAHPRIAVDFADWTRCTIVRTALVAWFDQQSRNHTITEDEARNTEKQASKELSANEIAEKQKSDFGGRLGTIFSETSACSLSPVSSPPSGSDKTGTPSREHKQMDLLGKRATRHALEGHSRKRRATMEHKEAHTNPKKKHKIRPTFAEVSHLYELGSYVEGDEDLRNKIKQWIMDKLD